MWGEREETTQSSNIFVYKYTYVCIYIYMQNTLLSKITTEDVVFGDDGDDTLYGGPNGKVLTFLL